MANDKELKKIKKAYGERFMKMCRTHFPTILNNDGELYEILQANFSDISETLYEDIQKSGLEERFVDFVFEKFNDEDREPVTTDKTPYELLDEAGYELVECHSEKEIQSFKKYYAMGEELCTFGGGRLEECVVFWAVKKNVDEIKRRKFKSPERDDEYGTSVMSIQFNREGTTRVSIKNRYNHTVDNPDATLGNDLEKIAPGLTYSFGKILEERGLKLDSNKEPFGIPGYVRADDGKYYKYNTCIGNTFYCPENIVITNGEVQKIADPEKHYLIDCFLIDTEKKTISVYDEKYEDAFVEGLTDIQKISIVKDKTSEDGRKQITIQKEGQEEPIVITIDRDDKIIGYKNHGLREVGDGFFKYSSGIEVLDIPNLEKTGSDFCPCLASEELSLPKLKSMGDRCCNMAQALRILDLPETEKMGDKCFSDVRCLEKFNLSNLKKTGNAFFADTRMLKTAEFPSLIEMGHDCFFMARALEKFSAPNLKKAGNRFCRLSKISAIYLPNLEDVGEEFLDIHAEEIVEFETPKISRLKWFFSKNRHVVSIINRVKRAQRISRKDIARLDKQTELLPEEVKEADEIIEETTIGKGKETLINANDNII